MSVRTMRREMERKLDNDPEWFVRQEQRDRGVGGAVVKRRASPRPMKSTQKSKAAMQQRDTLAALVENDPDARSLYARFHAVYERADAIEAAVHGHEDSMKRVKFILDQPGALGGYIDRALKQATQELMVEGTFGVPETLGEDEDEETEHETAVIDRAFRAARMVHELIRAEMNAIWFVMADEKLRQPAVQS